MVFVKKFRFIHLLFKYKIDKKVFGKALETKEAFIDYKNIDLENAQNLHFSKVVRRWFLSKIKTFSIFCFNEKWIKEK